MTLDEWCDQEMLSLADRQAFKVWLGRVASVQMSHANWWLWFREWVRTKS